MTDPADASRNNVVNRLIRIIAKCDIATTVMPGGTMQTVIVARTAVETMEIGVLLGNLAKMRVPDA